MIRLSNEQGIQLLEFMSGAVPTNTDSIHTISEQVKSQLEHDNHAQDLIETIANILNSPKAKVILSGSFLMALRRAILSPRELASVKSLADTYQSCSMCGKELLNGEMASLHDQSPYCTICMAPISHPCPKCRSPLEFPSSLSRIISKTIKECHGCAEGLTAKPSDEIYEGGNLEGGNPFDNNALIASTRRIVFSPDTLVRNELRGVPPPGTAAAAVRRARGFLAQPTPQMDPPMISWRSFTLPQPSPITEAEPDETP